MKRVVSLGEIMLRLRAPGTERLLQRPRLEAMYGGAEFNVLASLARFGLATDFVTALPNDGLGPAALATIRQHGVGTAHIRQADGRLGLYFLEAGCGLRPARVTYDRAGSVLAGIDPGVFDWPTILQDADCLHLTGITPAISASAATIAYEAAAAASTRGVPLCLDINMRARLWRMSGRDACAAIAPLLRHARIVFATSDDWATCLPNPVRASAGAGDFGAFAQALLAEYPRIDVLIGATRDASSATDFDIGGTLQRRGSPAVQAQEIAVRSAVETVGGGDALVAGCLFGLLAGWPDRRCLDFAIAARALKHTFPGDVNLATLAEVDGLLQGEQAARVVR